MVKLWQGESAQWRVELELNGEGAALSLRMKEEGRVLSVCLGGQPTENTLRRAAAKAVKALRDLGVNSAVLDAAPAVKALGPEGAAALAQGAELACYRQPSWKQGEDKPFALYLAGGSGLEAALAQADAVTRAVCFARDLVNCPANLLTPEDMARRMAQAAGELGVEVELLDQARTRALGMGAYHAVADSAIHPPQLIVLRWRGGKQGVPPIALVGKGVCCDTGGYCLKTAAGLKGTRGDMAGGAAVCGALLALAENKIPVNAVAVIPAVENRLSADSFLPGDVIRSMSGKTIQVNNTDAEGRQIGRAHV